jgi:hypothetical protein
VTDARANLRKVPLRLRSLLEAVEGSFGVRGIWMRWRSLREAGTGEVDQRDARRGLATLEELQLVTPRPQPVLTEDGRAVLALLRRLRSTPLLPPSTPNTPEVRMGPQNDANSPQLTPADRVLRIGELLRLNGPMAAKDLASELDVTRETVRSDLARGGFVRTGTGRATRWGPPTPKPYAGLSHADLFVFFQTVRQALALEGDIDPVTGTDEVGGALAEAVADREALSGAFTKIREAFTLSAVEPGALVEELVPLARRRAGMFPTTVVEEGGEQYTLDVDSYAGGGDQHDRGDRFPAWIRLRKTWREDRNDVVVVYRRANEDYYQGELLRFFEGVRALVEDDDTSYDHDCAAVLHAVRLVVEAPHKAASDVADQGASQRMVEFRRGLMAELGGPSALGPDFPAIEDDFALARVKDVARALQARARVEDAATELFGNPFEGSARSHRAFVDTLAELVHSRSRDPEAILVAVDALVTRDRALAQFGQAVATYLSAGRV